ncbi:MAG: ankyrin repeat domain-containing protein [Planctomycetota bacterium]
MDLTRSIKAVSLFFVFTLLCLSGCQTRATDTLQYAIIWAPDRVPGILESGACDPNERKAFDRTSPLELAVTNHSDEGSGYTKSQMVLDLLEHGAEPKRLPRTEQARLLDHALYEHPDPVTPEVIEALLEHGLDPNAGPPHRSPLFRLDWTMRDRSPADVRRVTVALIKHGVDLNPRRQNGTPALHEAVEAAGHFGHKGCHEVAIALIAAGADLSLTNQTGQTALHVAIGPHDLDMIQRLVDAGAPLDAPDRRGHTPRQLITLTPALRGTIQIPERVGAKPTEP